MAIDQRFLILGDWNRFLLICVRWLGCIWIIEAPGVMFFGIPQKKKSKLWNYTVG